MRGISLEIWPTVYLLLLIATYSDFYASTLKKCKGKPEITIRGVLACFTCDCAHCARRISLKIWPTVLYLLLHIVTFMLQPFKMQVEARNCKNRHFDALRARLRALRARYSKTDKASTGGLVQYTFTPIFVGLVLYLGTLHPAPVSERRWPRALPSPNPSQKGNLLASLGG